MHDTQLLVASAGLSGLLLVVATTTGGDGTAYLGALLPLGAVAWVRADHGGRPRRLDDDDSHTAARTDGGRGGRR